MLVEISLTDFQAHANTTLKLRDGFSVVVGPTNVGKSSIVRAVRWLIYDSLRGTRHIRKGKDSVSVKLKLDPENNLNDDSEVVEIERVKGKANRYRFNKTWLDAVGVGVPPEVSKVLKIPLVQIDKDSTAELNVSMQLDSPFLIMETDSMRAKFLNVLTGVHILDAAVRETNRKVQELSKIKEKSEEQLAGFKAALTKFSDLPSREVRINEASVWLKSLEAKEATLNRLLQIKQNLDSIARLKVDLQVKLQYAKIDDMQGKIAKIDNLQRMIQIKQTLSSIAALKADLQVKLQRNKIEDASGAVAKIERLQWLVEADARIRKVRAQRILAEHAKIHCVNALNQAKEEFKNLPDQDCALCGQKITQQVRQLQMEKV